MSRAGDAIRAARVKAAGEQLHRSRLALHQALARPADAPGHGGGPGMNAIVSDGLPWLAQWLSAGLQRDLQATLIQAAHRALQAVPGWLVRHPLLGLLASAATAALLAHWQAAMACPAAAEDPLSTTPITPAEPGAEAGPPSPAAMNSTR